MNTRRGKQPPKVIIPTTTTSTVVEEVEQKTKYGNKKTRQKGRFTRRNGLQNITNTKSDSKLSEEDTAPSTTSTADGNNEESDEEEPTSNNATTEKDDVLKNSTPHKIRDNKRLHASSSSADSGSPSPKKRNISTNEPITEGNMSAELSLYKTVKQALGKHYFNVVDRLQLSFKPNCLANLEYCAKYHTNNEVRKFS